MSSVTFPNESSAYRRARAELLRAELDLRAQVERVATLRRKLPLGGGVAEDYVFDELDGAGRVRQVRLSELFDDGKDALFLYSFMFGPRMKAPCPMCSSLIDGIHGNARHLGQRINLAVTARSPIERIAAFAEARGWQDLRLLSCARNGYARDYFGENGDGDQMPMANVFVRREGKVHHFWGSEMLYAETDGDPRHVDMMWPLWNVLDTTPAGRGDDWYPSLER